MELRPHQEKAIEMLRASLRKGNKRPILAAPCSFGKTITAAALLKSAVLRGKKGIFICDRIKLVQQSLEAFSHHGLDFGVIQGNHELTNRNAPIQIASIQTLARRPKLPEFDLAIVDECQTHYASLTKIMDTYNNVPFIGLSATPYSKGLGKHYDDLIVPITPRELLDQGYLCPVDYYGGRNVSLKGVKTKALSTGGSDYDPSSLAAATEDDKGLVGDIVKNWLEHGENGQTIAFAPSIKHSKHLVDTFNGAGISAEHIDGYMDDEERQMIYDAHDRGEFKILSCSRLLNTGYDAPKVSCLIDCFPTKSLITFVQRAGRVMRTSEGKDKAVYLDHAGNVARHGFAEDIIPDVLDDGTQRFDEKKLVKEKKEAKVKECPQCTQQMVGLRCKCGYEIPVKEQLESTSEILTKLTPEQRNKTATKEDKSVFYSELLLYSRGKGYKDGGWASHKYRERYGVWPNAIKPHMVDGISDETRKYITSTQIRYSKRSNAA
jgi:DNA repair protein RadD